MLIRAARVRDTSQIQRLYELLVPGRNVNVLEERISEIANHPHNFLFVAEHNQQIVGTVFLTICLDPMFGTQSYGVIENVIVDPLVRGKGVGKLLFTHIEQTCIAHNCSKLMLLSGTLRTEAHRFFEAQGFQQDIAKGFKKYLKFNQL